MNPELTVIKTAYEDEGMTPEQIAQDRDLDLAAVKSGLIQCSSKYRKDCGHEDEQKDELNFSDDELRRVNGVIMDLAMGAEDEHLRFKAASYIRDDKKGRKEIVKNVQGTNLNILFLNERFKQVREAANGLKNSIDKSINV